MNKSNEIQIFTQAYNQGKPVVVLVYMNGCPYCEPVVPVWDDIRNEIQTKPQYKLLNSKINITKIERNNLNTLQQLIKQINSYPTFLHMGKGIKTTKHNPNRDYNSLFSWIKKLSHHKNTKGGKRSKKNKKRTKRKKRNFDKE